jgi:heme a synthase
MPFDDRDFPNLPREERAASPRSRRLVGAWLYGISFMILVMVALGGATRVTGSGLSIMEWDPIMGVIPPMSNAEWHHLFGLYRHIAQYRLVNEGFGLAGFKHIFWLEWTHRLWGRLIGAAFLLPLIWFLVTGRVERRLLPRLVLFFVLGGLQGAVGWFMVASGFEPGAISVEPVRLVLHLGFALVLYCAVLWTALSLAPPEPKRDRARATAMGDVAPRLRFLAWSTLTLVALTIVAGGFVAGLHAGLTYNTFPLMDGRLVPEGYADLTPFARNLIENVATVQFDHRLLATFTLLTATGLAIYAWRWLGWRAVLLGVAVLVQYTLGVTILLLVVPPALAVVHQICATLLLTAVLLVVHAVRPTTGLPRPRRLHVDHGRLRLGFSNRRSVTTPSAAEEPKP